VDVLGSKEMKETTMYNTHELPTSKARTENGVRLTPLRQKCLKAYAPIQPTPVALQELLHHKLSHLFGRNLQHMASNQSS